MALIFVGNEKKTSHVRGPPNDQAYKENKSIVTEREYKTDHCWAGQALGLKGLSYSWAGLRISLFKAGLFYAQVAGKQRL